MFQTMLDAFFASEAGARWLPGNMVVARAALREFADWLDAQRSPTTRAPAEQGGEWTCSECEATNLVVDAYCQTCGHLRPGG